MSFKRVFLFILAVIVGLIIYSFQPTQYPTFEMQPISESQKGENVLIFGATRNTGLEVARILDSRGDSVTAFVRPTSDLTSIETLNVSLAEGDAFDILSIEKAVEGKGFTSIVTTIACFSCDPKPDFIGNRNIFDVAKKFGVKRVVLVSTVGAGDSYDAAPWPARRFLKDMLPLKTQAEDYLADSGLDYTIIRPGGLKSDPASGRAYLSESREASGIINREDLAKLIVQVLDNENAIGKTLAAIDADMVFPWDMF